MGWHPSLGAKNLLPNGWRLCPPGAGGFATCGEMVPDGTLVARTDTAGAYLWNGSQWVQLATTARLPKQYVQAVPTSVGGCFDVRVAPSNSKTLYMALGNGNLFVSQNKGQSFVEAVGFGTHSMNPNVASGLNNHFCGFHMAADPNNDAICYLCTDSDGVWYTTDYINWQLLATATIPANGQEATEGNQYGPGIVQFDPTSAVSGGVTQHFWISSYGNGVYETTDGGKTFNNISGGSGPTKIWRMECAIDGTLWVCTPPTLAGNGSVYKYKSGTWTQVATGGTINGTLHDPNSAENVWLYNCGGTVQFSNNAGASFVGASATPTRIATDLPWLAATNEFYMSAGRMFFDTQVANKVWLTEGIGVWETMNLTQTGEAQAWTSVSVGINNLVPNQIVCPPGGGPPVVVSWDRAVFTLDSLVLSEASDQRWDTNASVALGFSVDYCKDDPNNLVSLSWNMSNGALSNPGTSVDGGHTWTPFPTKPKDPSNATDIISWGALGGSIVAGVTGNYLWLPGQGGDPFYTKDGGNTWNHIDLSSFGVTLANEARSNTTGWGANGGYYLKAFAAAVDHVVDATTGFYPIYLYNFGNPITSSAGPQTNGQGVYRSVDGGVTWTQQSNEFLYNPDGYNYSSFNFCMRSVPMLGSVSTAGHLFATVGPQTGNPQTSFARSTDGGATWSAVANVAGVQCFGFGACAEGETYPAVGIVGWVKGQFGIWVSFDDCVTWQWRGRFPASWVDTPSCIDGDKAVIDRWYLGIGGSGYFYYDPTLTLQ